MKPNIHILTFAFKLADELLEDFAAADGPNVTWHIFLHSQRPDVVAVAEQLSKCRNVFYYPYGVNRGMARSINEGLIAAQKVGADVVIMLCDDMLAAPGDIDRLAEAVLDNPHCSHVEGHAYHESVGRAEPSQLDASAINLRAIDAIGYFDRNCWPINFEDVDWKRRCKLAGYEPVIIPDTRFVHRAVNAQIRTPSEHRERMEAFYLTREYYVGKWGGDQGFEKFNMPWDDPTIGLRIGQTAIENPYPDHARADIPKDLP